MLLAPLAISTFGHERQLLSAGLGFSGLALTSIPTISVAYAVDCYKTISGEIMVVAT